MISDWLTTDWTSAWLVVVSAIGIFAAVVLLVRIIGLRSFSKMSSFDFAVTVATGSIVAGTATTSTSLPDGAIAIASLLGVQWLVAQLRRRASAERVVDNTAILLLVDGQMIEENLTAARVTTTDVIAKLREANCLRLADAHAVVLETTGDISVLHGGDGVDDVLLQGVRR